MTNHTSTCVARACKTFSMPCSRDEINSSCVQHALCSRETTQAHPPSCTILPTPLHSTILGLGIFTGLYRARSACLPGVRAEDDHRDLLQFSLTLAHLCMVLDPVSVAGFPVGSGRVRLPGVRALVDHREHGGQRPVPALRRGGQLRRSFQLLRLPGGRVCGRLKGEAVRKGVGSSLDICLWLKMVLTREQEWARMMPCAQRCCRASVPLQLW